MIRLVFALDKVLALAEHVIAAPDHKKSFLDHHYGTTPTPALWFSGGERMYLMSNGLPTQTDPANPPYAVVLYADGYRTSAAKHAVSDLIGGDDFSEVLMLLNPDSEPDGLSLHARLTAGGAAGARRLVIDLHRSHLHLYVDDPRGNLR